MRTQIQKKQILDLLIIIGMLILFFSLFYCNKNKNESTEEKIKKQSVPFPDKFDKNYYWIKISDAYFSKNAKDNLRKLRNEIFARHGRKFKSKYLQDYFENKSWYRENPNYHDGLLSEPELACVQDIIKYENSLTLMPDSIKELYENEVNFRLKEHIDTTIFSKRDYTGDGKTERQITIISKKGLYVIVVNIIIKDRDTLLIKTDTASFMPRFSEHIELLTDYETAVELSPPQEERSTKENWPLSIYPLIAKEIAKETGSDKDEIINEVKKYLDDFNGVLFHTITSESGGCAYVWYEPISKFITFYCP